MPANVVTIPNVELVKVGNFHASTGPIKVTRAMLEETVRAAQDPEIDHAPIKIGHLDSRFSGDGEPALGWVARNLRMAGDTLVGDLVDIPRKIAPILAKAFRRRSVEIDFGPGGQGVKTPSGKIYGAVLSGLALLGVTPPAVKGLADLEALYASTDGAPVGLEVVDGVDDERGTLSLARRQVIATLAARGVSEDEIMSAIDDFDSAAGGAKETQMPPIGGPPVHDGEDTGHTDKGGSVSLTDEKLRELLGLEADADVEKAILDLKASTTESEGDEPEGDDGDQSTEAPAEGDDEPAAPVPAEEEGMVQISSRVLNELTRNARAGAEARKAQIEEEVDRELVAAMSQGKFAPAEWQSLRDGLLNPKTAAAFRANLSARPAGVVAVSELGTATASFSGVSHAATEAAWADFGREVFGIESEGAK